MIRNKLSDANDVIRIRSFMQSDIEYVISRHKTLYYAERHLSGTFSAYVDKIVYSFVHQFNPQTDCLNVYETHGFYKVCSEDKSEWRDGVIEERWELEIGE